VTRDLIDFTRPTALLLAAVLPYIQDEDSPEKIITTLTDALPPGSYLIASHVTGEHDRDGWAAVQRDCRQAGIGVQWRNSDEFARLAFAGLEMVRRVRCLCRSLTASSAGGNNSTARRHLGYPHTEAEGRLCRGISTSGPPTGQRPFTSRFY
jgi:hypothetical protein